jgi:CTP:molybdopterin cytidylyltransferase MocA
VIIIRNEQWKTGQASSIRAAIEMLSHSSNTGGAIFLLSDQPQLTTSILRALREKHADALDPVIAPIARIRCCSIG